MGRLFGTDGVRGLANQAPMDSETSLLLGRAAAHVFRRSEGRHKVLIGKDTRVSGYMLETALASGIASMGVDVLLVGPLPTPGIAFMTRSMRADAGVVISASHNSYEDNGIKFFGPDGFKLADETEDEIERLMQPGHLDELRADPEYIGKAHRIDDSIGRYIVYLKSCLPKDCKFDGLKIALDAANGAAYRVAPLLFTELGANIRSVGVEPDGMNINSGCGSTYPTSIQKLVREQGADCGIAYDGDADRCILCDENGEVFDGDDILALLTEGFLAQDMLRGNGIVGTVMSNLGLEVFLRDRGLSLERAAVGDRYVLAKMQERGMNLGGEQSGHIISLDHNTTGDGILTSMLVVSALLQSGKSLSSFRAKLERCPQILKNVKVKDKPPLDSIPGLVELIDATQRELGSKGRILVRYSGTENKLRVMVECFDANQCERCADRLADLVTSEIGV